MVRLPGKLDAIRVAVDWRHCIWRTRKCLFVLRGNECARCRVDSRNQARLAASCVFASTQFRDARPRSRPSVTAKASQRGGPLPMTTSVATFSARAVGSIVAQTASSRCHVARVDARPRRAVQRVCVAPFSPRSFIPSMRAREQSSKPTATRAAACGWASEDLAEHRTADRRISYQSRCSAPRKS